MRLQHDIFANSVVKGTTAFIRLRQLKWSVIWVFVIWYLLALASVSHAVNSIINGTNAFLRLGNWNERQYDLFGQVMPLVLASVSHDADGVINGTTAVLRSLMIEMRFKMNFLSLTPLCTSGWYNMMPTILSMAPLHSLGQDNWNVVQHDILFQWHHWCWHQHYMKPIALSMAHLHSLGPRWFKFGATWVFTSMYI